MQIQFWRLRYTATLIVGALALIWFSLWLGGPQDCSNVVDVRIGHSMLLAGCDRTTQDSRSGEAPPID